MVTRAIDGAVVKRAKNSNAAEFSAVVVYQPDAETQIEARFDGDDGIWLTQADIARLFGIERSVITKHIKNAQSEELSDIRSTCAKFAIVETADGKRRRVRFYNLDAILSVGYRVKSPRGVEFRRWANGVLRERLTGQPSRRPCASRRAQARRPRTRPGADLAAVEPERLGHAELRLCEDGFRTANHKTDTKAVHRPPDEVATLQEVQTVRNLDRDTRTCGNLRQIWSANGIARCQVPHLNRNDGGQRERHHAEFLGSAHQSSPTANLRKTIQIKIVKKT